MHTAIVAHEGCTWCVKEMGFLHRASEFTPQDIAAYSSFYGIFGQDLESFSSLGAKVGYSAEVAREAVTEVADWLMANSPFRSLPRRCSVCEHAQGPEDLAYLREPVAA
jgi:hypothetical protein